MPFLLTVLGIGLVISTRARTQAEAFQLSMGTILPSVFFRATSFSLRTCRCSSAASRALIPATYYIQILRGIILRGAGIGELWIQALVLTLMGCAMILVAARMFVKQGASA